MIKDTKDSFERKRIGEVLQKLIVRLIRKAIPELTAEDIESVRMSVQGEDIVLSSKAREILQNAKFEAKSMKRGTSWAYDGLSQCVDNKILGEGDLDNDELFPILVAHNPSEQKPLAITYFSDFIRLFATIDHLRSNK
jgi:hypothetical protein